MSLLCTKIEIIRDIEICGEKLKRGDKGYITKDYTDDPDFSTSGGGAVCDVETSFSKGIWPYPNSFFTVALPEADEERLNKKEKKEKTLPIWLYLLICILSSIGLVTIISWIFELIL